MSLNYLRELRRKYRPLYREEVVTLPDGSRAFHHARHFVREGIHVLHLKGDRFEMAFQHGKLLSDQVKNGVLMQLSKSIPNLLHNSVSRSPLLNRIVMGLVNYMGHRLREHIPWDSLAESYALSEGSGLALHHVSNALLAMEALYILAKYAVHSKGFDINPMAFAGCTSFAAWNDYTDDRNLIIGRNLDYPLNGYFDAHPTVTYFEPTDGNQRYVSFGTAGLHTPSLTAMNESGIYLAGHIVPTEETSFQGMPMYFVASDVIQKARTFDEAVDRFRQHRTTTGWGYVLVSTREKRVASVEITNSRVAVRESRNGIHAQSNHFTLIESSNMYVNRSIEEDTRGRYQQVKARLKRAGKIDVGTAASILGDCCDPVAGVDRGLGATVAVHITVGSAVFEPAEGRVFVAKGTAPTSQNDFVEFPLWGYFKPADFMASRHRTVPGGRPKSQAMAEAVQLYIRAKTAYEYDSDSAKAHEFLEQVVRKDPENPAYRFMLAIFALKLDRLGEAVEQLSRVLGMDGKTPHLFALARYYRGRIHAHQGKVEAALNDLDAIQYADTDGKLKRAATKAATICRVFRRYPLRTDNLPVMMQFADLLNY